MVKLNVENDSISVLIEKALAVWFASVWGMLLVLINREETEGAFTRLNIGQWKLLPILDVTHLSKKVLKKIAVIFDEFHNKEFRNIHEQFSTDVTRVDNNRLKLDIDFLKSLDPSLNDGLLKESLLKLYGKIDESLHTWIGA